MLTESIAERRLIKEMQQKLGNALTLFLLAGYGEDTSAPPRAFSVFNQKRFAELRLAYVTDHPSGLPNNKEPLILLSMLKLVLATWDDGEPSVAVPFPPSQVCEVLEWRPHEDNYRTVNNAITKYYSISLILDADLSKSFEGAAGGTADMHRLIHSCRLGYEYREDGTGTDTSYMEVDFSPELIEEMRSSRFLGVDWDFVTSIEPVSLNSA